MKNIKVRDNIWPGALALGLIFATATFPIVLFFDISRDVAMLVVAVFAFGFVLFDIALVKMIRQYLDGGWHGFFLVTGTTFMILIEAIIAAAVSNNGMQLRIQTWYTLGFSWLGMMVWIFLFFYYSPASTSETRNSGGWLLTGAFCGLLAMHYTTFLEASQTIEKVRGNMVPMIMFWCAALASYAVLVQTRGIVMRILVAAIGLTGIAAVFTNDTTLSQLLLPTMPIVTKITSSVQEIVGFSVALLWTMSLGNKVTLKKGETK